MEHKRQDGTISSNTIELGNKELIHFPVCDTGLADHKCPTYSSFIYSCQSSVVPGETRNTAMWKERTVNSSQIKKKIMCGNI